MNLTWFFVLVCQLAAAANAQFGFFRDFGRFIASPFAAFIPTERPKFHDDGTQSPVATGNDELFPRDCGRDPDKGTGKLCFPDGLLCQESKSPIMYFE